MLRWKNKSLEQRMKRIWIRDHPYTNHSQERCLLQAFEWILSILGIQKSWVDVAPPTGIRFAWIFWRFSSGALIWCAHRSAQIIQIVFMAMIFVCVTKRRCPFGRMRQSLPMRITLIWKRERESEWAGVSRSERKNHFRNIIPGHHLHHPHQIHRIANDVATVFPLIIFKE